MSRARLLGKVLKGASKHLKRYTQPDKYFGYHKRYTKVSGVRYKEPEPAQGFVKYKKSLHGKHPNPDRGWVEEKIGIGIRLKATRTPVVNVPAKPGKMVRDLQRDRTIRTVDYTRGESKARYAYAKTQRGKGPGRHVTNKHYTDRLLRKRFRGRAFAATGGAYTAGKIAAYNIEAGAIETETKAREHKALAQQIRLGLPKKTAKKGNIRKRRGGRRRK